MNNKSVKKKIEGISGSLKLLIVAVFIGLVHSSNAQNLVLNPSFENTSNLWCSFYNAGLFNNYVDNWTCPTAGSTDLFHSSLATTCYSSPFSTHPSNPGNQAPRTGNAYVGVVTYGPGGCSPYREYVQGELSSPLVVGSTYEVSFWVSLADNAMIGTNNLGVKFDTGPVSTGTFCGIYTTPELNYTGPIIMDKNNWTQVKFCYTPTVAGQNSFIIGNFYDDASTSTQNALTGTAGTIRYFVDDVDIHEVFTTTPDATWAAPAILCTTNAPVDLSALVTGTAGGTFTGTGITGNTFDPTLAGQGTHSITYTIAGLCGVQQTEDIVVSDCVLPVELLEFQAEAVDARKVALTWTTVNEINNDYFEIERSQNGTSFNTIGWVDGAGNSNVILNYNDYDEDPYNGVSYYRLKQTDFDGTYTYSDIRTVVFDDLSFVNMYPNPAEDELQFTVLVSDDADLHVNIVDVTGRVIMRQNYWIESGESSIKLDVSNLASGIYTIRVNTNEENHLSKNFIRR